MLRSAIDSGTQTGKLHFYTGTKPAETGASITDQTLLGTARFSKPCATILDGVITFEPITSVAVALATGVIAWARITNSENVFVADFDCNVEGWDAIAIFNTLNVLAGGEINVQSGVLTEGNL